MSPATQTDRDDLPPRQHTGPWAWLKTRLFSSPLSVDDFVTASQFTCYTKEALEKIAPSIVRFAGEEGLEGHARIILSRFEGKADE